MLSSKRVLYVGGLADSASVQVVRAAFIPFGAVKSLDIPMDYVSGKHKGFAFVELGDPDDVTEAIFNMDGAELLGRTLKVSLAQANQISKLSTNEAIWKSDDWFQQHVSGGQDEEAIAEQRRKEEDAKALQEL